MRCEVCGRGFKEGDKLIPVTRYVTNERRGDFVPLNPVGYIHLRHLTDSEKKGAQ